VILAAAAAGALALGSIDPAPARSQPATSDVSPTSPAVGSAVGSGDEPTPDPEPEPETDDGAAVSAIGAAPADPGARRAWLAQQLDARVAAHPRLAAARVGIEVVDVATGERLYARDADGAYNLASNTKVITSAAALATLGPAYTWQTSALCAPRAFDRATGIVDGDLYLKGRGDPTLRSADLHALAADLAALGVRKVTGALVLDATFFDDVVEPPHFDEQPKERAGFRAPVAALSIDGNATTIVVEPGASAGALASVRLEPHAPATVRIVRQEVITAEASATRIGVATKVKRDVIELTITGQINVLDGVYYTRRRIDDPVAMVGEVMRAALAQAGIRVSGRETRRGPAPAPSRVLAAHDSADLSTVLRTMNKWSNNFIAEAVFKTVGAEAVARAALETGTPPRPATWADAAQAVQAYLGACAVPTPPGGTPPRVSNGSGLFASTDVSPAQQVAVLRCAAADFRVAPDLIASLPIAGLDGTLRRRLQAEPARGRVRAKTGTLAAVTTLSGFAGVDGGRLTAFAVLVNDVTGSGRADARLLQDEVAATLVTWAGP